MNQSKQILNQAFTAHRNGRINQAESLYLRLIKGGFRHEAVLNNLAAIWTDRGEYDKAIELLLTHHDIESSAQIQSTLSSVFKYKGELEQSVKHARNALALNPDLPDTWNNLGSSLRALGRWEEGVTALNEAISREPKFALALYNLGNAYLDKRSLQAAVNSYKRAIEANPDYSFAYLNLGNCYRELRQYAEAEGSYIKAQELNPSLVEATFNLGIIYMEKSQFPDAISCFSKTLSDDSYHIKTLPHLIGATQKISDWTYTQQLKQMAEVSIKEGKYEEAPPFNLISIFDDPALIFRANQQYTKTHIKPPLAHPPLKTNDAPLRVAYFSNDIHNHATGYLIAELFELHDSESFDITLISYGPDSKSSEIRERIRSSNIRFIEASLWSNPQIIEFIRNENIQILIDLKGYTAGCRPQVMAARAAPIQIQYLGYPATMGCDFIDYFIGDEITLPEGIDQYFSEQLIRMPHCYQINDSKRKISATTISRIDEGLPEDQFVFTSFNSTYKISQDLWNVWMAILKACDNSVLWMIGDNEWAQLNLIENAQEQGVDPTRIIFAKKKPQDAHLARLPLGDLALDTYPCCGHTTTSDALYAGLPVLTLLGNSFHSRVSASLLAAQGLDELITQSIGEYATNAVAIASSPEHIQNLKNKTLGAKKTGALFNTPAWVKEFERILLDTHRTHQAN